MGTTSKMVNVDIMGVVVWLVIICVGGSVMYVALGASHGDLWYLGDVEREGFLLMTARFFLICYQFVPI